MMKERAVRVSSRTVLYVGGRTPGAYRTGHKKGIIRSMAESRAGGAVLRAMERDGITPGMIADGFDVRESLTLVPENGYWVREDTPALIRDVRAAHHILKRNGVSPAVVKYLEKSYWVDRREMSAFAQKHHAVMNRAVRKAIRGCVNLEAVRRKLRTGIPDYITERYVRAVILPGLQKRMASHRPVAYKKTRRRIHN